MEANTIVRDFILNGCYGDSISYAKKNTEISKQIDADEKDGQWSYIVEMMIITIKSLIPSKDVVGTIIDYRRFQEELVLWNYYRHGKNSALLNSLSLKEGEVYWNSMDDSVYSRIAPIVFANKDWSISKEQIIINTLYTNGNIEVLLQSIALGKLIHLLVGNKKLEIEELISDIKEEIISFSQVDFLKNYEDDFRFHLNTYPSNYSIGFERHRINLLNLLNDVNVKTFSTIGKALDILKGNVSSMDDSHSFIVYGLIGLLEKGSFNVNIKDKEFITNLSEYLVKLRNGRIPPESLNIDEYYLPDVFDFKEGDIFNHTLLNRCKVIKKEETAKYTRSIVMTKSGNYRFIKGKTPK